MKSNEVLLSENERLDDLLFKGLKIIQDKTKYCFTTDSVLLANFVRAKKTDDMVDLCSGSGIVGILAQAKTHAARVVLVELQMPLAKMSEKSVKLNGLQDKVSVVNAPLQGVHKIIGTEQYNVVCCNPPYKMEKSSLLSENYEIDICKHEITVKLEEIVFEASKLLKYGGYFYTINKEERLVDLFALLRKFNLEPKQLAVVPSPKGSGLVLVSAKKGGKSGLRISVNAQA